MNSGKLGLHYGNLAAGTALEELAENTFGRCSKGKHSFVIVMQVLYCLLYDKSMTISVVFNKITR